MCESIRPGITRLPRASMVFVDGPASFITSASSPTAMNLLAVTAKACACGLLLSTVATLALRTIRSAYCDIDRLRWCCLDGSGLVPLGTAIGSCLAAIQRLHPQWRQRMRFQV